MLTSGNEKPVLLIQTPNHSAHLKGKRSGLFLLFFYICLLLTMMKTQAIWPPTEGTVLPRSFQKRYVTVSHEAQQRAEEPMEAHLLPCRSHLGHPTPGVAQIFPRTRFTNRFSVQWFLCTTWLPTIHPKRSHSFYASDL